MYLKYYKQAGIGESERRLIDVMTRSGKLVIRADDLQAEFGYKRAIANLLLSRLSKKGWLQRLKSGIYRIVPLGSASSNPVPEDAWAIAMEIFSPCYISGWSAAEHWDLTEQIFNSTVIFSAQKQKKRDQEIAGLNYRVKFIHAEKIFGVKKIWSSNTQIQIADIHRTVIDILADPEVGGGGRHALDILKFYWQKKEASPETLWQYAEKLDDGAVFRRLGYTADAIAHLPDAWLKKCRSKIKSGIIKFDPAGPEMGSIVTKWGVRVNLPEVDIP